MKKNILICIIIIVLLMIVLRPKSFEEVFFVESNNIQRIKLHISYNDNNYKELSINNESEIQEILSLFNNHKYIRIINTNQRKATHSVKIALWVIENNRITTLQLDEKKNHLIVNEKKYLITKKSLFERISDYLKIKSS